MPGREAIAIENQAAYLEHGIAGGRARSATLALASSREDPLVEALDVVAVGTNGTVYRASSGSRRARLNAYRHGLYYADVRVLDLELRAAVGQGVSLVQGLTLDGKSPKWAFSPDLTGSVSAGSVTAKVKSARDPYFYTNGLAVPLANVTAVRLHTRVTGGQGALRLFYGTTTASGFSGSRVSGAALLEAQGEYEDVILRVTDAAWSGTLTQLRVDLDGAAAGAELTVDRIEFLDDRAAVLPVRLERVHHLFADRLYLETVAHFTGGTKLTDFYVEASVPDGSLRVDAQGKATALDPASIPSEDLRSVRLSGDQHFAWVLPRPESLTLAAPAAVATNDAVTAHAREGGGFLLRHHAGVAGHAFVAGEKVRLASRVVLGAGDGARAVEDAVRDEWEPLTARDFTVRNASDSVRYARYDSVRGLYRFESPGMGFSQAFSETPNEYPSLQLDVTNTDRGRQLYVMQATASGGLEAAVWLDASRRPLPIPIQVSKNFGGEKEEPFFVPKDASFGESIAPLVLEAGEHRSLTLQHLYQNWGRTPLKQLSSVSFFVPYYHSSTGVTETSCWVPHFVDNAGWILPDFRARSGVMWSSQPQFDSVGKNVILRYQDASGRHLPEYVRTEFESVGPVYSAFTMHFVTDDGKARLSITPTELPHTGEHRAFTRVRVEFQDAVTIENASEDFELFSTKSDHSKQRFLRYGFWGAAESRLERTINYADAKTEVVPLGKQHPYWALYDFTQLDDTEAKRGANIGLLVRRADIVLGGKPYPGSLAFALKKHGDGLTTGALTFPAGRLEFKKGDLIDLDLILLPYGSVATKSDANLVKLRQQWAVDELEVTVTRGTKSQDFVPTLRAENGVAEFEFKGGSERTVVRVEGFRSYQAPTVECEDGGELVPVSFSVRGQDGMQAYVAADGTYGFAFPVELGKPGRCRVTGRQ